MKRRSLVPFALALLVPLLAPPPHINAAREGPDDPSWKSRSRIDQLAGELILELESLAGDAALDTIVVEDGGRQDYDIAVLGDDNPLISDECFKLALRHATATLWASNPALTPSEALERGIAHAAEEREARAGQSYGDFFQHVAQCEDWCRPMVVSLEQCHIEAVAGLVPRAVFFDYNSDGIADPSHRGLSIVRQRLLTEEGTRILLVGRGSRVGDKVYNRDLSRRRTESVRGHLVDAGIEPERIDVLWFGWEPPQITGEVAAIYQIGNEYRRLGQQGINQSVILVVYQGEGPITSNL